jgi:hypothetical protein
LIRPSDALAQARGDVRDGAASIEHLLQVLGSRRVGPRVLGRALPEVHAGCAELLASLGALERALAPEMEADPEGLAAVRALLEHAAARVGALAAALTGRDRAALDARERLALEAVVRPIAGELATLVRLVDLLGAHITGETTPIDFADALAGRRPTQRGAGKTVVAAVEIRTGELQVSDTAMILELLAFAVAAVVRAGVTAPRIVVETGADGFPVFTVGDADGLAPAAGRQLEVPLGDPLPREVEVLRAAARHAGIKVEIADDGRRLTIAF